MMDVTPHGDNAPETANDQIEIHPEAESLDSDAVPAGDAVRFGDEDDDSDESPTFMSRLREHRLMIFLFAIAPIWFGAIFFLLAIMSIIVWPFSSLLSLTTKDEKSA